MAKPSLRMWSLYCVALWAAIWCLYMLMRFSPFDIRLIPGIGPLLLASLVVVLLAPLAAALLACIALFRQPGKGLTLLALAGAIGIFLIQMLIFSMSGWM